MWWAKYESIFFLMAIWYGSSVSTDVVDPVPLITFLIVGIVPTAYESKLDGTNVSEEEYNEPLAKSLSWESYSLAFLIAYWYWGKAYERRIPSPNYNSNG